MTGGTHAQRGEASPQLKQGADN